MCRYPSFGYRALWTRLRPHVIPYLSVSVIFGAIFWNSIFVFPGADVDDEEDDEEDALPDDYDEEADGAEEEDEEDDDDA